MKLASIVSAIRAPGALLRRERALYLDHYGPREYIYQRPALRDDKILVKSVMTGICSSDVAMMNGKFPLLPREMHGHEGLGIVEKIGNSITDVKPGDYVATRGEPAYADRYNALAGTYVKVPELDPKYILEPVACALNLHDAVPMADRRDMVVIGTGFLAKIIYRRWLQNNLPLDRFHVVGNADPDFWGDHRIDPTDFRKLDKKFKSVIELKQPSKFEGLEITDYVQDGGVLVIGHDDPPTRSFPVGRMLWSAIRVSFPSPRSRGFYDRMLEARDMIQSGKLNLDGMWSHAYNRDTSWEEAFEDADQKPVGFQRGYLVWS